MTEEIPLWKRLIGKFLFFYYRNFTQALHLKNFPMVEIGSGIAEANELYGEPDEIKDDKENEGALIHTYDVGYREVIVSEKEGKIVSVSYWSDPKDSHPQSDLNAVLENYGCGKDWADLTPGYSKVRTDGRRRVNFSAMPCIGIVEVDYEGVREHHEGNSLNTE